MKPHFDFKFWLIDVRFIDIHPLRFLGPSVSFSGHRRKKRIPKPINSPQIDIQFGKNVFDQCVLPVMTNGSEIVSLTKEWAEINWKYPKEQWKDLSLEYQERCDDGIKRFVTKGTEQEPTKNWQRMARKKDKWSIFIWRMKN